MKKNQSNQKNSFIGNRNSEVLTTAKEPMKALELNLYNKPGSPSRYQPFIPEIKSIETIGLQRPGLPLR